MHGAVTAAGMAFWESVCSSERWSSAVLALAATKRHGPGFFAAISFFCLLFNFGGVNFHDS